MSIKAGIAWRSLTLMAAVAGLATGSAVAASGNGECMFKAANNACPQE